MLEIVKQLSECPVVNGVGTGNTRVDLHVSIDNDEDLVDNEVPKEWNQRRILVERQLSYGLLG